MSERHDDDEPSGATALVLGALAVAAGVVAALGSLICVVAAVETVTDDPLPSDMLDLTGVVLVMSTLLAIGAGAVALLYLLGAILIFRCRSIGRVLVVVAAVGSLAVYGFAFGTAPTNSALAALVFAATITVLAFLPSTARWIEAGTQRRARPPATTYLPYPHR